MFFKKKYIYIFRLAFEMCVDAIKPFCSSSVTVLVISESLFVVLLTWIRHLASTSCSLVCASSSSRCLSCSWSPSFSSSCGSLDVRSPPGAETWSEPTVLNRSLQRSQPMTLFCVVIPTQVFSPGKWVSGENKGLLVNCRQITVNSSFIITFFQLKPLKILLWIFLLQNDL